MRDSFRLGRLGSGLVAVAVCLTVAAPASAADLTLRVQGQVTSSDADALGLGDDFGTSVGGYLGLEYPFNERLGLEFGVGWMEFEQSGGLDVDFLFFSFESTASLTMTPVTVALDVHLTPSSRYDLYLAPKIGWAFFDDLEIRTDLNVSNFPVIPGLPVIPSFPISPIQAPVPVVDIAIKDQLVYGLRLGFDVPFGDSAWSFASSVEILGVDLEPEAASGAELGLDPVSVGLGVGYRF
ncbi:MAG: porin family protein [bacterium]|nr:porin family protein [bacterium]